MYFWSIPTRVPVLLGHYRLIESLSLSLDFMLFEIIMCGILYIVTRGVLLMKVAKLERATAEANHCFNHLSQEPNSLVQNKCLRRCLNVSDAALNEYDSLLMYFGNLQNQPTRKVCLQRWPSDLELMRKMSTEESFMCLKGVGSESNAEDRSEFDAYSG